MPKRKKSEGEHDGERGGGNGAKISSGVALASEDSSAWSKSKKKRMRRMLAQKQTRPVEDPQPRQSSRPAKMSEHTGAQQSLPGPPGPQAELALSRRPKSALQLSFLARLSGSRFRELNEDLYTSTSEVAFKRFSENPELFDQYHVGFRKQVEQWPVNPVNVILRWIKKRGKRVSSEGGQTVVADFGCGDAKLGKMLMELNGPTNSLHGLNKGKNGRKKKRSNSKHIECAYKVHSFDLVANGNPLITPCDMSNVPLEEGVADIGVFCLALMGTNIGDFIREAHRVLRQDGVLMIAEVRSRFEATADGEGDSNGKKKSKRGNDTLLNEFLETMEELGFSCAHKDRSSKMFILMEFVKIPGKIPSASAAFTAKPCIYKRR